MMHFCFRDLCRYFSLSAVAAVIGLLVLVLTGCLDDEDYYDHVPPAGKGSLVIDNNTADDISLYVDGVYTSCVNDCSERIFDLDPGVYRIVLDEEDGDRNFSGDVDILEGRLTILDVVADIIDDLTEYDVVIEFD